MKKITNRLDQHLKQSFPEFYKFYDMPALIETRQGRIETGQGKKIYLDYKDKNVFSILNDTNIMVEIKDLLVSNHSLPENLKLPAIEFSDPIILWAAEYSRMSYFHLIHNVFASIDIIQSFVPNATVKIIGLGERDELLSLFSYLNDLGLSKAYGIKLEDFLFIDDYSHLKAKSVYMIDTEYDGLTSKIVESRGVMGNEKNLNAWGKKFAKSMRNKFIYPQKIFISRLAENDSYRKVYEVIKKIKNGETLSEEEKKIEFNEDWFEASQTSSRLMDRLQERLLEEMFRERGYLVVNPGGLGDIHNQARLFNSAKYIVGLAGAGFINCCFCSPGAKVLVLNAGDGYTFPHDKIVQSFGVEASLCPKRMPWKNETPTAEYIFNQVKSQHPDFL
jgi:hypothetical protein